MIERESLVLPGEMLEAGVKYSYYEPAGGWLELPAEYVGKEHDGRHYVMREDGVKWSEGPIPEPTGYCIVFMEFKEQSVVPAQEIVSWYCDDQMCWKWNEFKPLTDLSEGKIHHFYTGRWYIQTINLPKQ